MKNKREKISSPLETFLGITGPLACTSCQERVDTISRLISQTLKGPKAALMAKRLEELLKVSGKNILPEDRVLVSSYLYVFHMQAPVHLAVVMHLFSGHIPTFDSKSDKPDILGIRINQLQELAAVNQLLTWDIFLVADGGFGLKSCVEEFIAAHHPADAERLHVFEVDPLTLAKLHSFKGAPIVYGLRQAIEQGADLVTFPDFYRVPHLAQMGNLMKIAQGSGNPVAIGSRRLFGSIIYKVWFRRLSSSIFNKWVWLKAPELIGVSDTQSPLKLYPRHVLKDILPVDTEENFDPWFDYGLSFDVELLRRTVRKGYQWVEIPSLDVLEMSARPSEHFILNQSRHMAAAVSAQSRRWEPFHRVFRIFATGGESFLLGHPSQDILIKIPRYYRPNFLRNLVRDLRSARQVNYVEGASSSNGSSLLLNLHKWMGKKTTDTTLGTLLQALFMWRPFRPFAHTLLALAESQRGEEFPRVQLVQARLGGLVTPFEIQENIEISVLMPFLNRLQSLLVFLISNGFSITWRLVSPLRWLIRTIWHALDPPIRWIIVRLIQPWAAPLFVWLWSRGEVVLIYAWRVGLDLIRQTWHWASVLLRPVLIRLLQWVRWVLSQLGRLSHYIHRQYLKLQDNIAVLVQRFLDRTGLGELLRRFFLTFRPISESLFRSFHWIGKRLHFLLKFLLPPYEHIVTHQALVMEKVVTIESLLSTLRTQKSGVRDLIDRYVELQKDLWRRGSFNRDSNILEDSGLDAKNRLVLVDFTEVVFSLEEAERYLQANSDFSDRFHFRIFEKMTSREDLEYYKQQMRSLYTELLSDKGRAGWGTRPYQGVQPPNQSLQVSEYSCNSILRRATNKWRLLVDRLIRQEEANTLTYLPVGRRAVPAAVLERELNEGSPTRRALAEEIIGLIGQQIGKDLDCEAVGTLHCRLAELVVKLPHRTRRVAEKILALSSYVHAENWEKTKTAQILQRAIEAESRGRVHLNLPLREISVRLASLKFLAREWENTFDNKALPESSAETPHILAERAAQEPFVMYSFSTGFGSRLGLLSVQNTKPELVLFNRRLLDYSRDIILRFFPTDPQAACLDPGWIVLTVGDNFYLPDVSHEDWIRRVAAQIVAAESSFIYFDMTPGDRDQNSFSFWLAAGALALLERASRFGQAFSRLIYQQASRRHSTNLVRHSGGSDLPGVIFIRPQIAVLLFECIRGLTAQRSAPSEFHRDLILPLKVSLAEWKLLWTSDSGLSQEIWINHWKGMQRLKQQAKPLGIIYDGLYLNANSSQDIYNLYRGAVDPESPLHRQQIRQAAGLDVDQELIGSEVTGEVVFYGAHLLFKSKLSCASGVRLCVEENVVIDDSELEFLGPPGNYVIPRGTVIVHSRYRGCLDGKGTGAFWYMVDARDGQGVPFLKDAVTTTLTLAGDRKCTGSLPMDFDPKNREREPLESFGGLTLADLRAQVGSAELSSAENPTAASQEAKPNQIVESRASSRAFGRFAWLLFFVSTAAFIYYLINYFFVPQFHYTGPDGLAGSDFITYYLGPLVDKVLGANGSVFSLGDFRSAIAAGLVEITHPNSAYAAWALRSPEGFISTPFTLFLFRHSLSLMPFWLSLNLWILASIGMLATVAGWSASQALHLSKSWRRPGKSWELMAVALLVFGFAPSLVSIGLGQINPVVLLLTAISLFAFMALSSPRPESLHSKTFRAVCWTLGPLCLALAIHLKIAPAFFLILLLSFAAWKVARRVKNRESFWKSLKIPAMFFVALSSLWIILIAIGTIGADGLQRSLDWLQMALPRAMQSSAVIAPADLPDLETYILFLMHAGVLNQVAGQVLKFLIMGIMAILAIEVSRIASLSDSKHPAVDRLRLWLGFSFWVLALFTWTFMRCHYLILTILVFPPLLATVGYLPSRSKRALIIVLAGLSYVGFSHPIPFYLVFGGIPNYISPNHFLLNGYNLMLGYPATLVLAAAVWIAMKGLKTVKS